jgi:hypothetical protein
MKVILARAGVGALLTLTAASTSFAQRIEPIAASSRTLASSTSNQVAQQISPKPMNPWGGVAVGVLGGSAGFAAGLFAGATLGRPSSCSGEYCGLEGAVIGAVVGEAVGLAVGTHYGSRGHANLAFTFLTSTAISAAGIAAAASSGQSGPMILSVVPVIQLAILLAMER